MFPLRGAENDIQNHLLFFIFLGQGPPCCACGGGILFFLLLFLVGGFRLPPPCGGSLVFTASSSLCVLFCDQKSTRKVPLVPRRPLGGQNDGRHPAKLARSCASKPHWGFDCFATAQSRLKSAWFVLTHERFAKRALKNLTKDALAAARRRFLYGGIRSR